MNDRDLTDVFLGADNGGVNRYQNSKRKASLWEANSAILIQNAESGSPQMLSKAAHFRYNFKSRVSSERSSVACVSLGSSGSFARPAAFVHARLPAAPTAAACADCPALTAVRHRASLPTAGVRTAPCTSPGLSAARRGCLLRRCALRPARRSSRHAARQTAGA